MNYEKMYKEALEDMRVIYPNLKGDAKLAVEHAFPELAEGEDERIRKELIETINCMKEDHQVFLSEQQIERYLSYLEKQKEQKPEEVDESTKRLNDNWMKQHFDDYKERKPAEWSEEDEDRIRQIERIAQQAGCTQKLQEEIHDWLKSLRPSWKPNDEDEVRLINTSISFLKDFADKGYENAVECIDWLKSKLNGTSTNAK